MDWYLICVGCCSVWLFVGLPAALLLIAALKRARWASDIVEDRQ